MLSSFCSPLNSIPDIPGIISVVTAGVISVVGIISVVIGGYFGGGDHLDGGDHVGGGTGTQRQFSENICSEDDLRSRIVGTFVVKFLACLPLLVF